VRKVLSYISWVILYSFGLFLVYTGYEIDIAIKSIPLPPVSQYTTGPSSLVYLLGLATLVTGFVLSGISIWSVVQLSRKQIKIGGEG